jgi:hypothetical protein
VWKARAGVSLDLSRAISRVGSARTWLAIEYGRPCEVEALSSPGPERRSPVYEAGYEATVMSAPGLPRPLGSRAASG